MTAITKCSLRHMKVYFYLCVYASYLCVFMYIGMNTQLTVKCKYLIYEAWEMMGPKKEE